MAFIHVLCIRCLRQFWDLMGSINYSFFKVLSKRDNFSVQLFTCGQIADLSTKSYGLDGDSNGPPLGITLAEIISQMKIFTISNLRGFELDGAIVIPN